MELEGWRGNVLGEGWCPANTMRAAKQGFLLLPPHCLSVLLPAPHSPCPPGVPHSAFCPPEMVTAIRAPAQELASLPAPSLSCHRHQLSPSPRSGPHLPTPCRGRGPATTSVPPGTSLSPGTSVPPGCARGCGIPEGRSRAPSPRRSAAEQSRAGQPTLPLHSQTTSLCHEDIY